MHRIALPFDHRETLQETLGRTPSPYDSLEEFLTTLYPLFANLPQPMLNAIFKFRSDPACYGALLLENFPTDTVLPPTPHDAKRPTQKHSFVSEACVLGVAQLLGEPLGYRDEKEGEIVHNLCPVRLDLSATTSDNCEISLGFHTDFNFDKDNPFQPYDVINPDYVLLTCLRPDKHREACTRYADARDICARLTEADLAELRKTSFIFAASYSFTGEAKRTWSVPAPVIKGPASYPEISLDLMCGVKALNPEAAVALGRVKEICELPSVAVEVRLKPGDILLMDNRKGAHSRSPFFAAYDGLDRWLQRVYVRRSLWELRKGGAQAHTRVY